jgi:hypothetical protein
MMMLNTQLNNIKVIFVRKEFIKYEKFIMGLLAGYVLNKVASKFFKTKVEFGTPHYSSKYPKDKIVKEMEKGGKLVIH